jgi:hypothetical protein
MRIGWLTGISDSGRRFSGIPLRRFILWVLFFFITVHHYQMDRTSLLFITMFITALSGAAVISPLPSEYWVQAQFTSQNEASLISLFIIPTFECMRASYFGDHLGGSINESRYAIVTDGQLHFFFCNTTNCTTCSSFTTLPLNQYSSNGDGFTMYLVNQLPTIQDGALVTVQQKSSICPATADNVQSINVQSPSCALTINNDYYSTYCNGSGWLVQYECPDNQCSSGCTFGDFSRSRACGELFTGVTFYFYCYKADQDGGPVSSTVPETTPNTIPRATPVDATPRASSHGFRLSSISIFLYLLCLYQLM